MRYAAQCALFVLLSVLVVQVVLSVQAPLPASPAVEPQPVEVIEPIIEVPPQPVVEAPLPTVEAPPPSIEHREPYIPPPAHQPVAGVECEGGICRPGFRLFRGLFRR
jgi:hypothetical protein